MPPPYLSWWNMVKPLKSCFLCCQSSTLIYLLYLYLICLTRSWYMFQTFQPTDNLPLASFGTIVPFRFAVQASSVFYVFSWAKLIVLQLVTNPSTSKTAHIRGASKDWRSAKGLICTYCSSSIDCLCMSLQLFLFCIHCLIQNPLRCMNHFPQCLHHLSPLHCNWVAVLTLCHASVRSESKNLTLTNESWQKEMVSRDQWIFLVF